MNPFVLGRRPDDAPEGWATYRMKDVTEFVNRGVAPEYADGDTDTVAFNQRCVRADRTIDPSLSRPMKPRADASVLDVRLRAEDVVINSTGTGTLGRAGYCSHELIAQAPTMVADGHVTIVRCRESIVHPKYLWYLLSTDAFYGAANSCLAVGATNQMELGRESIRRLGITLPSTELQTRIVAMLDAEATRVDELVREQQNLADLLVEHEEATIDDLIWDKNGERSSTKPLWHITPDERPIMYGIVLPGPNVPEGISVVKGGDVRPERLDPDLLNRTTPEIEFPYARARLQRDDIVYAIRGSIGDAAVVPASLDGANITQDVARITPGPGVVPRWLLYAVRSRRFFSQMDREARGATIRGVNIWSLKKGRVPATLAHSQQRIADALDDLAVEVAVTRAAIDDQMELLREHRQALITAAVTGRVDLVEDVA